MAKGGSPEQTSTFKMSPEQENIYKLAMPGINDWAATVPGRYPGSTIAPQNPNQIEGQNMALDAAGGQSDLARGGANVTSQMFGDIWNPDHNPNLRGAIDAAVRPITQNFQNTVLPGIRGDSISTGNFGGSRQAIGEVNAADAYMRNVGDTSSKLVQNEYETNMNSQLKALGLLPQTLDAQTAAGRTTSAVGDVQNAYDQALRNQDVGNFNYDNNAQFLQSRDLLALLTGLPGGSNVSSANTSNSSPWLQSLAGAGSGASIGSVFGPVGTAVGGGAGAILPWVFR